MSSPADPIAAPAAAALPRRQWLALASATGLASLGTGLWLSGRSVQAAGEALPKDFWQQQFDTLSGTPLKLSTLKGQPLLINFWAPWCPPCVKELPEFSAFHQAQKAAPKGKGCQVLGLAIDGPTPVREFLAKTPVSFPIGLAGFGGTELAQALGNASGGLPFTVLVDAQGRLRQRKMGTTSLKDLQAWAKALG